MAKEVLREPIGKLPAPTKGHVMVYDTHEKAPQGFAVRITAAGARTFVLCYRRKSDGIERRMAIGSWPAWSLTAARLEAAEKRRLVDQGRDPFGERRSVREAENIKDLCQRFNDEHVSRKRPGTQADYRIALRVIERELGEMKVADVSYEDVAALHRKITKGSHRKNGRPSPYQANRTVAVLSKAMSMAMRWRMRTDNPCRGIERNHEDRRERYLSDAELERLTAVLDGHHDQEAANIIRLLLLIGNRSGELYRATWDQFDLERGTWTKPAATVKQARTHHIPLSAPAQELLASIKGDGPELFPGWDKQRMRPHWSAICKAAGISGLRIHDLRHSYASTLVNQGVTLPIIGALLGHTQVATTHRYAHLVTDVLQHATERAGAKIAGRKTSRKEN